MYSYHYIEGSQISIFSLDFPIEFQTHASSYLLDVQQVPQIYPKFNSSPPSIFFPPHFLAVKHSKRIKVVSGIKRDLGSNLSSAQAMLLSENPSIPPL